MNAIWKNERLGDVCIVVAGQSPEGKFYNATGEGLPFYQGKKGFGEIYLGAPTTWTTRITKEALEGDILMSVRAPVGPINLATEKICIGRGLAGIRTGKDICRDFLFYFLRKFENEIVGSKGAVFDSISRAQIENIQVPLPSISEQKRIVKILDEVFGEVAKVKENAEKNLKNSKELFESYLKSELSNSAWEIKKLGEHCRFQNGFAFKGNLFKSEGFPVLRISNIQNDKISYKRLVFFDKNNYKENLDKYQVLKGDLVIAMSGATTGKLGICDADEILYLNQRVGKFEPEKNLLKEYLYYFLSTRIEENLKISAGAAQPNLSTEQIKNLDIPLPPIIEQKAIVKKLDALSAETKMLEGIYAKKLTDLEELKKSVLRKAFAGEL